jgi:hypothetical protein
MSRIVFQMLYNIDNAKEHEGRGFESCCGYKFFFKFS